MRNDIAAIVPVAADGRTVFVVPWGDFTYVGTTDTEYDGPLDDPVCTADDVDYLLGALNGILQEPVAVSEVDRDLGGAATAAHRRPPRAPPTSPAATRCGCRRAAWSR